MRLRFKETHDKEVILLILSEWSESKLWTHQQFI